MSEGSPELAELREGLADDDHVQSVEALIASTNHDALYEAYRGTGSEHYRPERILAVVLLLILAGIRSPSKWATQVKCDDRCKLVGRGIRPSRTTLYNFRDRAAKFIEQFHTQVIRNAIRKKTIDPKEACLDGTFVAAAASRHKMFPLKRVSRRLAVIKRAIRQWDDPSQTASQRPMKGRPSWLAETATGRQQQLQDFRAAKAKIVEEIRLNRQAPSSLKRDESEIKICPTDVDAVIGKDKLKVTRPLYNVQYVCDLHSDVILSYGVFCKKNDCGTLIPMIDRTHEIIERVLEALHVDAGYSSILEVKDCIERSVNLFAPVPEKAGSKGRPTASGETQIPGSAFLWDESTGTMTCPGNHEMRQVSRSKDPRADGRYVIELRFEQDATRCQACPLASQCLAEKSDRRTVRRLEDQHLLDDLKKKMDSDEGRNSKKMRTMRIERRHADSKKHRGGAQLHGRGLSRATAETGLMVVAQNCLTLFLIEKRAEPG